MVTVTNRLERHWAYASKLVDHLIETGLNTDKKELLVNRIAKWSRVNFEIYGYDQLHEDQLVTVLEDISKDVNITDEGINELLECQLLNIQVDADGEMTYCL